LIDPVRSEEESAESGLWRLFATTREA